MLTGIQTLKTFGIFDEYTRPAGMKDFCDRNVIYGWNYSGKTTLSRLFHALNEKVPHPDMVGCKFSLTDQGGATITEVNLAASTKTVRVFNSDFVSESLNWNGRAFSPILLLGAEARDAKEKIEHYEEVIKRCSESAAVHRRAMQVTDERLSEGKTVAAKHIKTTLDIVEAFTAVHLNQLLTVIGIDDADYVLTQEQLTNDLSLATSSEKDKLPAVAAIQFASAAPSIHGTAIALFKQKPASSNVIEALRAHPQVSDWVSEGLTLHKDKETCEFCLNPFTTERRGDLHAHFSKEVTEQRRSLETLLEQVKLLPFKGVDLRETDLSAQFRPRLKPLLEKGAHRPGGGVEPGRWSRARAASAWRSRCSGDGLPTPPPTRWAGRLASARVRPDARRRNCPATKMSFSTARRTPALSRRASDLMRSAWASFNTAEACGASNSWFEIGPALSQSVSISSNSSGEPAAL